MKESIPTSFTEKRKTKPASDSGQYRYIYNDVTSDYDSDLMGRTGSCNLKRMLKSDPIIGGIITSYKNPILSANWTLQEIENASAEELKAIDILNAWFFNEWNFGTVLNSILSMLPIGFSLFEQYYKPFQFENNTYMLPVLEERIQTSIYRIDYKGEYIEQYDSEKKIIKIPFSDLVFFTFRQEGNDKRGVSLLRQAYYDYKDKKDIKLVAKKGITRLMLGLPVGKVPTGVSIDSTEYQDFEDLILDLGSREDNQLSDSAVIPEGYTIEMLKADFNIDDLKSYISYIDSAMATSVLTQFMTLGQNGNGGAYSLGRDQSDMFLDGLQFIIDYIEEVFNKYVLQKAVKINFPNVDHTKFNLVGLNLDKKNSKEFAEVIKILLDSGIIKAELQDEVKIRKMYDLPEIDMQEREKKEEEEKEEEVIEEKKTDNVIENKNEDEVVKLSESWNKPSERNSYIDQETDKITKYSRASLTLISDELQRAIRNQLNKGKVEAQGLKDVQINSVSPFKKGLGKKLAVVCKKAWSNAKSNSTNHIKLSEIAPSELPTQVLVSFVINQADLAVDKMTNDLRDEALFVANTYSTKGYAVNQIMAQVEAKMDKYIESNGIELSSLTGITQAMSYGEMEYYRSIEDNLYGYEFVNEDPVTQICKSLVGKIYRKDSPAMLEVSPPLHFRCKSYFVPVYKDDPKYKDNKPDFDDYIPPPSILDTRTL